MPDGSDPALLDRLGSRLRRMLPGRPQQEFNGDVQEQQYEPPRPASHTAWLRKQFEDNPQMRRDYLQASAAHPHLFRLEEEADIVSHVEPVVRHFAPDGLTRHDYLRAVAADPLLLRQKPDSVISNLEAVMAHYAADRPMRSDYLRSALAQPVLFRTPQQSVFAAIEATADRLEAHEPQVRREPASDAVGPPAAPTEPLAAPRAADASSLPSTLVQSPSLYVSFVGTPGLAR